MSSDEFLIATLLEHFHLTPSQVGSLTRTQISKLYFHPRDEQGALEPPKVKNLTGEVKPTTNEEKQKHIDFLREELKKRNLKEAPK